MLETKSLTKKLSESVLNFGLFVASPLVGFLMYAYRQNKKVSDDSRYPVLTGIYASINGILVSSMFNFLLFYPLYEKKTDVEHSDDNVMIVTEYSANPFLLLTPFASPEEKTSHYFVFGTNRFNLENENLLEELEQKVQTYSELLSQEQENLDALHKRRLIPDLTGAERVSLSDRIERSDMLIERYEINRDDSYHALLFIKGDEIYASVE